MYIVAQFGAATKSLMKATIDGNFEEGVQFIGQSQGLIDDIPYISQIVTLNCLTTIMIFKFCLMHSCPR
jgi:hypothetical protein